MVRSFTTFASRHKLQRRLPGRRRVWVSEPPEFSRRPALAPGKRPLSSIPKTHLAPRSRLFSLPRHPLFASGSTSFLAPSCQASERRQGGGDHVSGANALPSTRNRRDRAISKHIDIPYAPIAGASSCSALVNRCPGPAPTTGGIRTTETEPVTAVPGL